MMLPGGVVCMTDSDSAMVAAVRKSGINRCVLMIEGSRGPAPRSRPRRTRFGGK